MATDDDYNKLGQYVAERLNQGATPETIKNELRTRNINPEMVDYVLKRMQTNNTLKGKDVMARVKVFGALVLIIILLGVGVYYYNTSFVKKEQLISKPRLFASGFESTPSNSTVINATDDSSYPFEDYNNVPRGWTIVFDSSGKFKWDDGVFHSGSNSIRMSNPAGSIAAVHATNLLATANRDFVFTIWAKSNELKNSFAFVELSYKDSEGNTSILERSKKIIGSNNWDAIDLPFTVPPEVESIRIKLKLVNRNAEPDLYEKLPDLLNGTAKINENLPRNTVWFDDLQLSIKG